MTRVVTGSSGAFELGGPAFDYLKAYPKAVIAISALMEPFPFIFPINPIIHVDESMTLIGITEATQEIFSFTFIEIKHDLGISDLATPHINQKELLAIWAGCRYGINKYRSIPSIVIDSQEDHDHQPANTC
ncbi:unnamed protein product [Gordionus sp. m RMFG-2023]